MVEFHSADHLHLFVQNIRQRTFVRYVKRTNVAERDDRIFRYDFVCGISIDFLCPGRFQQYVESRLCVVMTTQLGFPVWRVAVFILSTMKFIRACCDSGKRFCSGSSMNKRVF